MSEQNKAVFQQFISGMNARDIAIIDRLFDENYVEHNPAPGFAAGIQGLKDIMEAFFSGFPDLKLTTNQMIAEGDIVCAAMATEGTQSGEFMGIPASGKKISVTDMHMVRVVDGKVVEHCIMADSTAMMQQLGVMPDD